MAREYEEHPEQHNIPVDGLAKGITGYVSIMALPDNCFYISSGESTGRRVGQLAMVCSSRTKRFTANLRVGLKGGSPPLENDGELYIGTAGGDLPTTKEETRVMDLFHALIYRYIKANPAASILANRAGLNNELLNLEGEIAGILKQVEEKQQRVLQLKESLSSQEFNCTFVSSIGNRCQRLMNGTDGLCEIDRAHVVYKEGYPFPLPEKRQ